jgi:hypothetical protein
LVPFACTPGKPQERPALRTSLEPKPAPRAKPAPAKPAKAKPAPAKPTGRVNPYTGKAEPWGCGKLQQEPYRVQCDPESGHCYHDLGLRAECGLAHDWNVPE